MSGERLQKAARRYLRLAGFLLALLGAFVACGPTIPSEEQYLVAAKGLRASLRYDLALARYADASRVAPTDPLPYCLTGDVRELQQEWPAASIAYANCVALGPQQAGVWLKLGDARQRQGDTSGATAALEQAADLDNLTAKAQLALAAEQRGDVAAAQQLWQRLPADNPQALAQLGLLALWQGNAASAGHMFQLATSSIDPSTAWLEADGFSPLATLPQGTAQTQGELGHAFLAANLPGLAVVPFERAVALAPQDGVAHAYLGWTLLQLGRPLLASQEISRGLTLAPSLSFVWFAAGELALAQQQPALALRRFQEGTLLDPKNPVFWAEASSASLSLRDYTGAELMMQTASSLSNRPDEAIALLHIYVDFHLGFQDGSARRAGIEAITRWPDNEAVEFLLAEIFVGTNEAANAYYAAEMAHLLDPTDPGPYIILGAQAENEGDYVIAALDLRTALALRPDGPFAPQAEALLAPIANISA